MELKTEADLAKYTSDSDASVVGELLLKFQALLEKSGHDKTMVIAS